MNLFSENINHVFKVTPFFNVAYLTNG